ncbi:MAG TPA: outer membrane lipoprotein carrier protein LolA [bacterium]|nr:outer membrane lipoprotein carrier protein LolA [bacterium]
MRPWRLLALALLAGATACPLAADQSQAPSGEGHHGLAPLRFLPGDVLQGLLEAQDRRAWTRADIVKSEQTLGEKRAPSVTKGTMVASGGRARLEISSPSPGLIVADGKFLWVELPQVGQVYRYRQSDLAASGNFFLDLASSIRHYAKDSVKRRFRPGPGYDEKRVSAFELVPTKTSAAGFERLRVWVDVRRWIVLQVQLDYGGSRSDISFTKVSVISVRGLRLDPAQKLPKDSFKYRRPKGYELFKIDL